MIRHSTLLALVALVLFINIDNVVSQCSIPSDVVITNETAPPGTVLFRLTRPRENSSVVFTIKNETLANAGYRSELKDYFLLTWTGTNGTFTINKTLDLEEFSNRFNGAELTTITVEFTCDLTSNPIYINVQPLNEFSPKFQGGPYYIKLDELTSLQTQVFTLQGKVSDLDVPAPSTFFYGTEKYLITELDASSYFDVGATTIGNLRLIKPLSFDDKRYLRLNISVKDSSGLDAHDDFSTLFINVTDADNQKPYFNLTGCPKPCIAAPYFAVTTLEYTGSVTIQPEAFRLVDDDTLGTRIFYSIQSGDDNGMFQINRDTGAILQARSVNAANFPDAEIRLVIQARKNLTSIDLSNIAILTVRIAGRTPVNDTDIPPIGTSTEKNDSSLLIPVIVLGIILVLLIVAIIVVVLIVRKKQREASVRPDGDNKSEPQTEEEDLPSDRSGGLPGVADFNGKVVMNGKTTQGMSTDPLPPTPGVRANQLPPLPLRDSATETTEGRRKKRSRRRNKNKEPEIFDGTREYNMGEEPEFFDSTDKSKVKRSQRSYDKKVDPALWIKVPNDNPQNDDSGFSG